MPKIYFIDVTNRDGVQTSRICLSKLEKTIINLLLNDMGVYQSEMGFPVTRHETNYINANLELADRSVLHPIILEGWIRAITADVEKATEMTRIEHLNLSISTSDQMIFGKFQGKFSEKDVTRMMTDAVDKAKQRGIKIAKGGNLKILSKAKGEVDFEDTINYYRSLLAVPSGKNREKTKSIKEKATTSGPTQNLDVMLYNLLIKPIAEHIKGKKNLIIIPDGVLCFLPFETLIDDNGKYLIESYNISYAQSVSVLRIIKKRRYDTGRKPLLAFGGAVYDPITYSVDMKIQNEKQLDFAIDKTLSSISGSSPRSVRDIYAVLEKARWNNLPGTLAEVNEISETVSGTIKYTGNRVTENTVKALSSTGDLEKYKVIHFATHGLVVPEIPELSAIVLSQFKKELGQEDGYLRMGEIAKLNIKADFVNLSACDTGLGKIYGGEGVVGLTQSFLIAGANGLSVSLWEVADDSTSKFMVAMYDLVEKKRIGYDQAITEIKRRFINGDFGEIYRASYFWAPFVYYGKTSF